MPMEEADYKAMLVAQYRPLLERYGRLPALLPKSHWEGCEKVGKTSAVMPYDTPAEWISCNSCLIGRGYIRIVHCDPRLPGWPDATCEKCEYGLDHENWLRVKGVGESVEQALRCLDAAISHPVTWGDTGLVPFMDEPIPPFDDKVALDAYCDELLRKCPSGIKEPWSVDGVVADIAQTTLTHRGFPDGRFTACGIDREKSDEPIEVSITSTPTCEDCR